MVWEKMFHEPSRFLYLLNSKHFLGPCNTSQLRISCPVGMVLLNGAEPPVAMDVGSATCGPDFAQLGQQFLGNLQAVSTQICKVQHAGPKVICKVWDFPSEWLEHIRFGCQCSHQFLAEEKILHVFASTFLLQKAIPLCFLCT